MGKINVLDVNIANMIAAGEVVERPSSVVKELVENSIDANSKHITVEIKNGGMSYIRITDDGDGIEPDDVRKAFLPHATSKIKTSDDLNKIYTLGFRGEALASIASVAKVEIYTKTKNNSIGKLLTIEGGIVTEESDAGCSDGTTIIIRNLFFNTPARMKFLKKDATESSYISDIINKIILGNPSVSIKYINSQKQLISSGDGDLKSSVFTVYGKDYLKHLINVNFEDENIKITGVIGNSSLSRKNRNYQTFYINNRNIMNKTMSAALAEAFKNTVMVGMFPFAILNISINSSLVDINVHPTKMEVRFSDDRKIFDAVYWACKNALNERKYVPNLEIKSDIKSNTENIENIKNENNKNTEVKFPNAIDASKVTQTKIDFLKDSFINEPQKTEQKSYEKPTKSKITLESLMENNQEKLTTFSDNLTSFNNSDLHTKTVNFNDNTIAKTTDFNDNIAENKQKTEQFTNTKNSYSNVHYKIVGQIFSTYIIVEKDGEMIIIDQHAAHERLYFEEFLNDLKEGKMYSQMMLVPATFDLSPIEFDTVMQNIEFFKKMGFLIEPFGENVIIIREVLETLIDINLKDLILELIEIVSKSDKKNYTDTEATALHTMACKRAIKGNKTLTNLEMQKLVDDVFALNTINTCPHGRPIEIKMTKKELEKSFKRIV